MNQLIQTKEFWQILAGGAGLLFLVSFAFNVFDISITPKWTELKVQAAQETEHKEQSSAAAEFDESELAEAVLPSGGVKLPIAWGNLGGELVESGVLDEAKLASVYAQRGGLTEDAASLLRNNYGGDVVINSENANFLLNLFWAFGLANKNKILEEGPMQNPQYGGDAGRFASTGGWTLARGDAMEHYSKHQFVSLTAEQQALVERVSQAIYRPCCGNSTYFPDCNHGMAMLGLLEIMAGQGASEAEMYKTALAVNSYWFPGTYLTIAKYLAEQGVRWQEADHKLVLGQSFSSATGFRRVLSEVPPVSGSGGGGGCGV